MKVKDLPIPLQKLVILRTRSYKDDIYYKRSKDLSDEEILENSVIDLFNWSETEEGQKFKNTSFWNTIHAMKWTDDDVKYAEFIVGNIVIEPLLHF